MGCVHRVRQTELGIDMGLPLSSCMTLVKFSYKYQFFSFVKWVYFQFSVIVVGGITHIM